MFRQVYIEIIVCGDSIWQACEVLKISARHLYLTVMLIHIKESIQLLVYHLHYVIRHSLPFKVLQELFSLFLLLIPLISKMLLEALIDFLEFLLSLRLVGPEIILLLEFVPDLKFVHKVCEETIDLLHPVSQVWLLVNFLDLVTSDVHQELVGVNVLRHSEASQKHVDEVLHQARVERAFDELQVSYELLVLCHLV